MMEMQIESSMHICLKKCDIHQQKINLSRGFLYQGRADLDLIWGQYTDFRDTYFGRPDSKKLEKGKQSFA